MTVMETPEKPVEAAPPAEGVQKHEKPSAKQQEQTAEKKPENIFSDENIKEQDRVELDGKVARPVTITPGDKIAFVDSVVGNTRFKKDYALFGGKVMLTLRSLTTDEVNALSAWIIKSGASDSSGLLSGRYRKYLAAAQVEMLNNVQMPVLEAPLFETLEKDGKTVTQPGWIKRCSYWDDMSTGLFDAIMARIKEFDDLYATLCRKAEDVNFWNPDTP